MLALKILEKLAPNARIGIDVELEQNQETGKFNISRWNENVLGDKPSDETLDFVVEKVEEQLVKDSLTEYKEKRRAEYPPITDYLDGIVKNDQAQIQKYIDDCLAVKAKYPKP